MLVNTIYSLNPTTSCADKRPQVGAHILRFLLASLSIQKYISLIAFCNYSTASILTFLPQTISATKPPVSKYSYRQLLCFLLFKIVSLIHVECKMSFEQSGSTLFTISLGIKASLDFICNVHAKVLLKSNDC